jgi:hypothetical protein
MRPEWTTNKLRFALAKIHKSRGNLARVKTVNVVKNRWLPSLRSAAIKCEKLLMQALRYLVSQNVGSNFVKNRCHLQRCINNFQPKFIVFQNYILVSVHPSFASHPWYPDASPTIYSFLQDEVYNPKHIKIILKYHQFFPRCCFNNRYVERFEDQNLYCFFNIVNVRN